MSHHFDSYEYMMVRHKELMAQAEIERQLQAACAERPSLIARARVALGKLLISAGESLARAAQTPGRV